MASDLIKLFERALRLIYPLQVSQFVDGTLLINTRVFKKIFDGYAFSVSHRFEAVATDGVAYMYIENPSGSGRNVYIVSIEVISTGQGWVDIFRGSTITTTGTAKTPVNLNYGIANTSVCTVYVGGSYTEGTPVHSTVLPGGSGIRAFGSMAEVGEAVVMPADGTKNLLVKVTNKSSSSEDISIRAVWWEEPV